MSLPIQTDVIRLLALYLTPLDIIHVGKTCKTLAANIFHGGGAEILWRQYVAKCVVADVPVSGVAGDAQMWQRMAFERDPEIVRSMLQAKHLTYRLAQPQSSKEFLRFFARVDTTGRRPMRDLLGGVIPDQFEEVTLPSVLLATAENEVAVGFLTLNFFPANQQQVLWWSWDDESMLQSTVELYAVDRKQMPPMMVLKSGENDPKPVVPAAWNFRGVNRLSPSLCREAGKLAHNDETYFFVDDDGYSYNYNSNHGNFRDMGKHDSRYGFASNSRGSKQRSRVREMLNVVSIKGLEVSMDLKRLYELFCSRQA